MDLSFSGAGFMGCYYFGVVNCWNKYIPRDRVRRVAGSSAGSLIAAYYLLDLPIDVCLHKIVEMTEDIRARPLGVFDRSNQVVDNLPKVLEQLFPEDAHKRVNGRLFVTMTRLRDMKCVIVNEFQSRQDLIDALNCSCFIPVWSGNHVATFRGEKYIDGGFTNNMPVFDEHTIRICCFSGAVDISPTDCGKRKPSIIFQGMPADFTWKNLKRGRRALSPPPPSYIIGLLERGFHDTKNFILSNDLIQCNRCFKATGFEFHPIHSRVTPTISPAASPAVSRSGSSMDMRQLELMSSASSFRRPGSKRAKSPGQGGADDEEAPNRRPLAPIRIKPHRQQQAESLQWEPDRLKSGKQIKSTALERMKYAVAKQEKAETKASFARKLREKLQRVASSSGPNASAEHSDYSPDAQQVMVPTIVVDQLDGEEQEHEQKSGELQRQKVVSILDIMKSHDDSSCADEPESGRQSAASETKAPPTRQDQENKHKDKRSAKKQQSRSVSVSSSDSLGSKNSSADSAVVMDAPSAPGLAKTRTQPQRPRAFSGSPCQKYFATAGQAPRNQRSGSPSTEATGQQEQAGAKLTTDLLTDRFSFAPSPLPSCPPSPSLNRHCTECTRMRQQARMDGIDDKIRREAEFYWAMESRNPEKEFNTIKYRLAQWFRQFGTPKYSYSFAELDSAHLVARQDPAETSLPLVKTRRRAGSLQPSSEIPTLY